MLSRAVRNAAQSRALMRVGRCFSSETPTTEDSSASRFLSLVEGEEAKDEGKENELFRMDLNPGGIALNQEDQNNIFSAYMENPVKNSMQTLSSKFHVPVEKIEAIIVFEAFDKGMTIEDLRVKIKELKEANAVDEEVSNEKEKKGKKYVAKAAEVEEEEVDWENTSRTPEIREPNFFFLNDDFDELPPLHKQFGKRKPSDKVTPNQAMSLQKDAVQNKVTLLPNFSKNFNPSGKWKIAIKDISKHKAPLYMRDTDGSYRLATDEEVVKRSWVKRPTFFKGIDSFTERV